MATKAKKNQPAAASEVAAAKPMTEQVVEAIKAEPEGEIIFELNERAEELGIKRARNYAQTAIDLADLSRLNDLKAHLRDHHKLSVGNQRIIRAALDFLADNAEAFLKALLTEAQGKAREKDLKKLAELQAKLGASAQAETN